MSIASRSSAAHHRGRIEFVARIALAAVSLLASACVARGHVTDYQPRDTGLRAQPLYWYPARVSGQPKAFVVFFGNDVAFWGPHQNLSWSLSGDGFAVVGVDLRKWLDELPRSEPQRDSAFAVAMPQLIDRVRREMHGENLPLILAGHSFGAELAFWIAQHTPPPRLAGILALNPRSTGHLYIEAGDLLNHEASGPWTFSTVDAVRHISPSVRIAIVRGERDPFAKHDPEFVSAGGDRLKLYPIKWASHSLQKLIIAGPIVEHAADGLVPGTV